MTGAQRDCSGKTPPLSSPAELSGVSARHLPGQPAASPTPAMGLPLMKTPEEPVPIEPPQPVLAPFTAAMVEGQGALPL